MTAMMIIIAVVVFWTFLVLGMLIGMSLHRSTQRRRIHRQGIAQRDINNQRDDLHESWVTLQDRRWEFDAERRRSLDG